MIKRPQIKRPIAAAVVRFLMVVVGVALVTLVIAYHRHIWQALVASVPAITAGAWSVAQKLWAARDKWEAFWTVPPKTTSAKPPKGQPMALQDTLAGLAGKVTAYFEGLAPEFKLALPPTLQADLEKVVGDAADEAKTVAADEVDKAAKALPPAVAPFAPIVAAVIGDQIDKLRAEADAKIERLTAAQAALTPASVQS